MNKYINKFIEDIILETSLDSRIDEGIFDVYNLDHLDVMGQHMEAHGMDKSLIQEIIERVVQSEGKYPERQAYNKDGWLVTFPSKEYRDIAIKKGTHSIADPTHGKGGMNLYYKRKGKQKRQVTQAVTQVKGEPVQQKPAPEPALTKAPEVPQAAANAPKPVDKNKVSPQDAAQQKVSPETQPDDEFGAATSDEDDEMDKYLASKLGNLYKSKYTEPTAVAKEPVAQTGSQEKPTAVVQQVAQAAQTNTKATEEFATQKGWKGTPYGEWRDEAGNTVAITSPSGEVTPT